MRRGPDRVFGAVIGSGRLRGRNEIVVGKRRGSLDAGGG